MSRNSGYVSGFRYERRVEAFSAGGTFTPPAGVTYAIAHIRAGGGGAGSSPGNGGTSSVAFAGGTISATGGNGWNYAPSEGITIGGVANSGEGARVSAGRTDTSVFLRGGKAGDGAYIVVGGAVTAGTGVTVTVGAGGTAGGSGSAGGSGYVWIEFEQPVGAGL